MFEGQVGELQSVAADRFGDELRSVASYDEDGFDLRYVRDDVDALYDDRDYARVFRTLRLEAMDRPTQDSLYAHGDLLCTYRVYEDATVIHVATSETQGVLVSVDTGADVDMRATTDRIIDVLGPVHSAREGDPDGTDPDGVTVDGESADETDGTDSFDR